MNRENLKALLEGTLDEAMTPKKGEEVIYTLDRMNALMIDFEQNLQRLDKWQGSGAPGAAPKQNAKLIANVRSNQVRLQKAWNALLKDLDTNLTGWGV